jgi:hypothetical protein
MAFTRVKIVRKNGKVYRYDQRQASVRVPGQKHPKSIYLGSVGGRKRKSKIDWNDTLKGGVALGIHIVTHGIKQKAYAVKASPHLDRAKQIAEAEMRKLDHLYGIDRTDADTYRATMSRMSAEMYAEYQAKHRAVWGERGRERDRVQAAASKDDKLAAEFKAFSDRTANRGPKESTVPPAPPPEKHHMPRGTMTEEDETRYANVQHNLQGQRDEINEEYVAHANAQDAKADAGKSDAGGKTGR